MMAPMNFHKAAIRYTFNAWNQLQTYICLICIVNTTESVKLPEVDWKKSVVLQNIFYLFFILKFKVKVDSLENLQSSCLFHFKFVIKVYRGRIAKTELLSKYLWN